jgi:hypothetical protein
MTTVSSDVPPGRGHAWDGGPAGWSQAVPRQRWRGLGGTLMVAGVVAVVSGLLPGLLVLAEGADDIGAAALSLALPTGLVALVLLPALLAGRWAERLTAVDWRLWLAIALVMATAPMVARSLVGIEERPRTDGTADTVSTYVVQYPGLLVIGLTALALLVFCGVAVGIAFVVGYGARDHGMVRLFVAMTGLTFAVLVLMVIYAIALFGESLGAHAVYDPHTDWMLGLPLVLWPAVPAVAALAGAEFWAEENR